MPFYCVVPRYNPKMKPLKNVCLELDFRKPTKQQVAKRMLAICQQEGLQTDPVTLETLAEMSNGDLRMLLGHLQVRGQPQPPTHSSELSLSLSLSLPFFGEKRYLTRSAMEASQ